MSVETIKSKFNIGVLLDALIFVMLIIQDIDSFRLFGTQMYKYVIILMLLILLVDLVKNKKTIKINKIYLLILFLVYLYLYVFSFCKTIIIPSAFFLIEILTFLLYIQSKESTNDLINSISKILLLAGVVISVFSVIQFVSFKLNIKPIYEFLTQTKFYLYEGRFSSIYTEPAHLCTIISASLFLSMYNIYNHTSKLNYIFFILLLFAGLISGSVNVYLSLVLFFILFYYVVFVKRREVQQKSKTKVKLITLLVLITSVITFAFFERQVITSVVNKIESLLSGNNYNVVEKDSSKTNTNNNQKNNNTNSNILKQNNNNTGKNQPAKNSSSKSNSSIDTKNTSKNSELQNIIMHTQLSNGAAYAMKSNFYIGIEKLKDKYFLGTGMFTHIVYYDKYMTRIYPNGYVRINYGDACSMFIRVFSEFGIIGLLVFLGILVYTFISGIKNKNSFLLFILLVFVTQSMRLGEYNWILNCLSFVILLSSMMKSEKYYFSLKIFK